MPLLSDFSKALSEFACQMTHKPEEYINADSIKIAERFTNFMQISIRCYEKLDNKDGKVVLEELLQACHRFQAKYISTPLNAIQIDALIAQSMQRIRADEELKNSYVSFFYL